MTLHRMHCTSTVRRQRGASVIMRKLILSFALMLLVATGGRQRSAEEFRELYGSAGFALTRIVDTPFVCVIEGAPAG